MKTTFITFINETKVSELYIGIKVKLEGTYWLHEYRRYVKLNNYAIVSKIDKRRFDTLYYFKLETPLIIDEHEIRIIYLEANQLKNIIIVNDDYLKHEQGEYAKYKATTRFNWILKSIGFKKSVNFLDVTDLDLINDVYELVSFIPAKKSKEKDKEKYRQQAKVGKILKKLDPEMDEVKIQNAVTMFRAMTESFFKPPDIQVVTGDLISQWYHQKNYQPGGGSLNNSCMRFESEQKSVKFYNNFPEQIGMAILLLGDRLWARAIIWKFDDGRVYMDRIYSVNDENAHKMKNFALEHGMLTYPARNKNLNGQVTLKNGFKFLNVNSHLPYFDSASLNNYDYRYEGTKKDIVLKF
jgi:hypothetical protein